MGVTEEHLLFGPFRCDFSNACVWRDTELLPLPPKAFAVLGYLLRHPGQLVSKEHLLKAVWAETYVGEGVLKVAIGEIRRALDDDSRKPRYIETVHKRGYRFLSSVTTSPPVSSSTLHAARSADQPPDVLPATWNLKPETLLVGRDIELGHLHSMFGQALQGERQTVFVTGEPGIGKTTLIDNFLFGVRSQEAFGGRSHEKFAVHRAKLQTTPNSAQFSTPNPEQSSTPDLWLAVGQCIEFYGAGEAYRPVLAALDELSRHVAKEVVVQCLEQYAPTWLAQMPALTSPADRQRLRHEMIGATQARMVREGVDLLEALTRAFPLILVLEDLHWSDYATLDLLSALARRRDPARLFVIGSYRPAEVIVSEHPLKNLKQELQARGQCQELPLELLSRAAVETYLTSRFSLPTLPAEVVDMIHGRTDGNPLFLTHVVEDLVTQGAFTQQDEHWQVHGTTAEIAAGIPENTRQIIERQLERLTPEEQRLLEVASAIGMEFPVALVDAVLQVPEGTSEEHYERLARQQRFVQEKEPRTWPDGTMTSCYVFTHALYQQMLSHHLTPMRRLRLHQCIGERLEAAYTIHTDTIAAELAVHFEQGRDYQRAVQYLRQAAEHEFQRYANREAIRYLAHALEVIAQFHDDDQRVKLRLEVLHQLGLAYRMAGDLPMSVEHFTLLRTFAQANQQTIWEVTALLHTAASLSWLDHQRCLAAAEEAVRLSQQLGDGDLHLHARAYYSYWRSLVHGWCHDDVRICGQALEQARLANARDFLGLHIGRVLYFSCIQAQYPHVCHLAAEEMPAAWDANDAHAYVTCQYFRAWALLHAGHWGEMLAALTDGDQMVNRNQMRVWQTHLRLARGWLYEQIGDWKQAQELCADGLKQAQELNHKYGEFLGSTLLGHAYLGLNNPKRAFQYFRAVSERPPGVLIDMLTQMPLSLGLSAYWISQRHYVRAQQEAELLCAFAGQSNERTYLALGHHQLADIACRQQNWEQAEHRVTLALSTLEGGGCPLAEWRVHALAAHLAEQQSHTARAHVHWQQSKVTVLRLADSLTTHSALQQTFLSQPLIRTILHNESAI